MSDDIKQILNQLNIKPKNLSFYQNAFIHRSYLNEVKGKIASNERLEFLGDSVLSLIVSQKLYTLRPEDTEGELTNLRSYIVRTESLAQAASKLNLGKYLKLSHGEEVSGGRTNPQILANTYESLLAAIYLDQGFTPSQNFVEITLLELFADIIKIGAPKDPKSVLQEKSQSFLKTSPKYQIITSSGPDHAKTFTIGVFINNQKYGQGSGASKQQAEEKAAKEALKMLAAKQ